MKERDLAALKENVFEKLSFFVRVVTNKYRRSLGYDGLDLRCFEVTNAPHKDMKDVNTEAVKLNHCDKE